MPARAAEFQVPAKLEETFASLLTLEDLYFNEHGAYAPDLRTLRLAFQVGDSLEYRIPDREVYVETRAGKPLLYALDQNGDSLIQVGKDVPRFSALNQNRYRVDSRWRISPRQPLEIRIELRSGQSFRGVLTARDEERCRFTARGGKSPAINGCPDDLEVVSQQNGHALVIVLSSTLLRAGPWSVSLTPARAGNVAGRFASRNGQSYPIRGRISKQQPLTIYGNPRAGEIP